jgi:hypothetical protein
MAEVLARVEKSGSFHKNWFSQARQEFAKAFSGADAPGPLEVAGIYRGILGRTTAPTEGAVLRVFKQFSDATGLSNA